MSFESLQEKALYPYQPEEKVKFNFGIIEGTGRICGQASSFQALGGIATLWIVELDVLLPEYPYRCIQVPSFSLAPIEPIERVSCFSCRFHDNNGILPCAVRPNGFTEGCPDWEPK